MQTPQIKRSNTKNRQHLISGRNEQLTELFGGQSLCRGKSLIHGVVPWGYVGDGDSDGGGDDGGGGLSSSGLDVCGCDITGSGDGSGSGGGGDLHIHGSLPLATGY